VEVKNRKIPWEYRTARSTSFSGYGFTKDKEKSFKVCKISFALRDLKTLNLA